MGFKTLLVLSALVAVSAQRPKCLITAPNIVHVGVEETVTVQLHGATKPAQVDVYFEDELNRNISDRHNVFLNEANDYQALVKMKVNSGVYTERHKTTTGKPLYISLTAESEDIFLLNIAANKHFAKKYIILSTRKGYIFIQTDKPIYNPGDHVRFRVFTLDNYLMPEDGYIQISISNSIGLMVYQHTVKSSKIFQKSITIPDVETAGHWKIVASFRHHPMSNSSVQFEVREYVLPTYEVKIEALKPYYLLTEESFIFNVTVRYTYGKQVNGIAYVRFGLIDEQGKTIHLPGLENKTLIQDGVVTIALPTRNLREKVENQAIEHMEGYSLHIAVTVIDSASGDLEEAESVVSIVNTPYTIDLSKTKEYFTPGGMFSILATTTYPDGSPAPHLHLRAAVTAKLTNDVEELIKVDSPNDSVGQVVLRFKAPSQAKSMDIKVFAEGEEKEAVLSDAKMTVTATKAEGESYLSVEIQHRTLEPGQAMEVTLRTITPPNTPRPTHIYYMVVSKGRVVHLGRVQTRRDEVTTVTLPFSVDLVPSFRLLAYYLIDHPDLSTSTIVADSVWADVKDVCRGKIEIAAMADRRPAELLSVEVLMEQAEQVALSALDTAVYILNKHNTLTPQKMFDYMNSYDLACTMGGGTDSESVLRDAGRSFISNFGVDKSMRKDYTCHSKRTRQKRDVNHQQEMLKIINRYKNNEMLKKCCFHGAKPRELTCEQRFSKTQHQPQKCRDAFLQCCRDATKLREDIKKKRKAHSLARIDGDIAEEENVLNDMSVRLRSHFPQTWMWAIVNVDSSGKISHTVSLPDSITTWEVQAVGISSTKGFCIAEPKLLTVFQEFFISLKLPYSVKRNEQLEVKAVVYNYWAESLEVTVEMEAVDGLCSAVGDKQVVMVPANSAVPVYFTVVPLLIGNIPIHIKAYTEKIRDEIKKDLKVLAEGELFSQEVEYNIDARSEKTITLEVPIPPNAVPASESDAYVSVRGGVMGQSVDNCLNMEGVDKLIALPKGCAEQTMVTMSPAIHATNYLDTTGQWIDLRPERRDEALTMIQSGYSRILTFKKQDGSYGAFLSRPSSIWLTAFIAKELIQCRKAITVEDKYILESIAYLVSKQLASGAFNDPNPLYDRTMQGGVGGVEADVSLTAYVLIAMHHALPLYAEVEDIEGDSKLREAMQKSESYLAAKVESLQRPFAMAITAYALSLISNGFSSQAQRKLRAMAKCDEDACHWEANHKLALTGEKRANQVPQADAISVETTAYALLQTVAVRDVQYATRIARWLTEQRKYGGGFQSTQDTVVALEALVKYSILDNQMDPNALDFTVELSERDGKKQRAHITKRSALNSPAFQVTPGGKITVKVEGEGTGTISLVQTYRTLEQTDTTCDYFNLNVSVEGEVKYRKREDTEPGFDDYDNYESEEEPSDEPVSRVEWFDLRTRRKRQAPQEEEREQSLVYHVCVGMNNGTSTGMVIVDISLLSGLQPNIEDLEDNAKGTERYIDHYDIAPNKVYLYFDRITEDSQCVTFRAEQISPIGLVQPAGAVLYDYYNPERRCEMFYSPPDKSSMLSKLCKDNVCSCAEGGCPKLKVTYSKDMMEDTRKNFACYSPIVHYVYVGRMINSSDDGVFKHHTTLLTKVLQSGKDVALNGVVRDMIERKVCEIDLKTDHEYLIMGRDKTISDTTDGSGKPVYVLDNEMWIEEIPEERRCRASKNRRACTMLQDFLQDYENNQCQWKPKQQ